MRKDTAKSTNYSNMTSAAKNAHNYFIAKMKGHARLRNTNPSGIHPGGSVFPQREPRFT
jgi:hypothetical protein